jgi:hypothetical protein
MQNQPAISTGKSVLVQSAKGKWIKRNPVYLLTHKVPESKVQNYISKSHLDNLNEKVAEDAAKELVKGAVTRMRAKKLKEAASKRLPDSDDEDDDLRTLFDSEPDEPKKEKEVYPVFRKKEPSILEEEASGLRGGRKPRKARTALEGYQTAADLDEYHKFYNRRPKTITPVRALHADPEDIVYKKQREKDIETYRIQQARKKHKTLIPVPETYNAYDM